MKTSTRSFGVIIAVARAYIAGWTDGNVDIAPFESEYGNGQRRIITSSFSPSCFNVNVRAAKRLSLATRRSTYFRKTVRDTKKEKVEPATVADARMSHPSPTP